MFKIFTGDSNPPVPLVMYFWLSLSALVILVLSLIIPWTFPQNLFIHHSPSVLPLSRSRSLVQTLVTDYPLEGIRLKFKATNDDDHQVSVALGFWENKNTEPQYAYQALFKTRSIQPGEWHDFLIPGMLPAGRKIAFELSADANDERASISPVISSLDTYPLGEATTESLNTESGNTQRVVVGDILFQPLYRMKGIEILKYYTNRIAFGKPIPKTMVAGIFLGWLWLLLFCLTLAIRQLIVHNAWKHFILIVLSGLAILSIIYYHPIARFTFKPF